MRTLYLTDDDTTLDSSGKYLRVCQGGVVQQRVPVRMVGQVYIFGDAQLTHRTIAFLAKHDVDTCILSRSGVLRARITGPKRQLSHLRHAQYELAEDPEIGLEIIHALVASKLAAQAGLLMRHKRNHPQLPLEQPCYELKAIRKPLSRATSRKGVRGIEGRAGAIYFGAFRHLIRAEFSFFGRNRRPPADPINAMLSFGYRLLRLEIEGQLEAMGLDPHVGFYHVMRAGRPSLALDIMEEFRVQAVDRTVLRCVNLGSVVPEDFTLDPAHGCRFTGPGLRAFIRQYHRGMERPFTPLEGPRTTLRRLLHIQAREMASAIRQKRAYRPHRPRL